MTQNEMDKGGFEIIDKNIPHTARGILMSLKVTELLEDARNRCGMLTRQELLLVFNTAAELLKFTFDNIEVLNETARHQHDPTRNE